jgi:hypothetical protein
MGGIPVEIVELKKMTYLDLSGNQLNGQHFFIFDPIALKVKLIRQIEWFDQFNHLPFDAIFTF